MSDKHIIHENRPWSHRQCSSAESGGDTSNNENYTSARKFGSWLVIICRPMGFVKADNLIINLIIPAALPPLHHDVIDVLFLDSVYHVAVSRVFVWYENYSQIFLVICSKMLASFIQ